MYCEAGHPRQDRLVCPMKNSIHIALAGNPNSGKTTLFNALTGARQHVGNYPGVTVEKKTGICRHNNVEVVVTDLPGTYSLTAYSIEELVARNFLVNERPEVVVNIVDASNLERNLYLTCQFMELGVPVIIALNMIDVAHSRGIEINDDKLSELMRAPVVPIVARNGKGVEQLLDMVIHVSRDRERVWQPLHLSYGEDLDQLLEDMVPLIEEGQLLTDTYPARWTGLKILEDDDQILDMAMRADSDLAHSLVLRSEQVTRHLKTTVAAYPEAIIADHRYGYIKSILRQGVMSQRFDADRLYTSDRIDKIVTNRFLGPLIMAGVLFGLYSFTFHYSTIPAGWLESLFGFLADAADRSLPDGPVKSMMISGVIDGVGGVLGFVPIIMFMFFGIAMLEDSGYLARVAFMMDRIFRIFGLHGSSVMPFIVSGGIAGGCAVPGVMATRTLRSPKERMATLLTVPYMNCGAKIPVLALLIGAFFSSHQARYMFLATVVSWSVALLAAKFFRSTVLRGPATPFVMELPPYRFPTFKGLLIHTWERTWQYIKKAGTVILGISILLWAMMTYPGLPEEETLKFDRQRQEVLAGHPADIVAELTDNHEGWPAGAEEAYRRLVDIDNAQAEQALRHSIAGRMGTALEPVSRFAGFDWRTNIALVGGFAAKEVIVSTLGTVFSLGSVDPEASSSLRERLARDKTWSPVVALAALVFIMFYAPCFVTVVCIAREAGNWKWALFSMAFNTVFAFLLAALVYQVGTAFYPG
jgi:ferrous iron transport protein B